MAEALPPDAAVGLREERLGDLVAAPDLLVQLWIEGMLPGTDAVANVANCASEEPGADPKKAKADDREDQPVGCDVKHCEEASEEHQR